MPNQWRCLAVDNLYDYYLITCRLVIHPHYEGNSLTLSGDITMNQLVFPCAKTVWINHSRRFPPSGRQRRHNTRHLPNCCWRARI